MVVTMLFCVGAEALWCKLAGKPVMGTIADGSAAVTGLLLAMNLPPGVPLWVCLIGAFLAIWLGKQIFGGIGNNPFNPRAGGPRRPPDRAARDHDHLAGAAQL